MHILHLHPMIPIPHGGGAHCYKKKQHVRMPQTGVLRSVLSLSRHGLLVPLQCYLHSAHTHWYFEKGNFSLRRQAIPLKCHAIFDNRRYGPNSTTR